MAWIELHQTLPKHRKTLRVSRMLNIDRQKIVGMLLDLWTWGLDSADKNGNLGDITAQEMAEIMGYSKNKAPKLMQALSKGDEISPYGFIEIDQNGSYILHDWYDYAGKLNDKREAERLRSQRRRSIQKPDENQRKDQDKAGGQSVGQPRDDREKTDGTVPNRTVPYILSKDNTSVGTDEQPFDKLNSAEDQTDTCPHRQIMELYNSVCVSLPKISKVTEARQTTLRVWWRRDELTLDVLREFFRRVESSDFLTGRTGNFHGCGFDWVIKPANRQKILEGNYDNTSGGGDRFDGIKT